jgi:hypothetical protein
MSAIPQQAQTQAVHLRILVFVDQFVFDKGGEQTIDGTLVHMVMLAIASAKALVIP